MAGVSSSNGLNVFLTNRVSYGVFSATPTFPTSPSEGDELFLTDTGASTGVIKDSYIFDGTSWKKRPVETITNFGTPVVTNPTANTINIALPYNQEGGTVQNVNIPITLPTPVSVVNSIDFKPTANANEFTVEITYTNDLGVQTTITDTTPIVFPRGAWDNPDGTPATQASGSINYTAGNVGIGTTAPAALLHTVKAGGNVARIESDGLYSGLVSYLPTSHFFSGVQDVDGVSRYNVVNNITGTEALSVNAVTSNTGLKLPQAFNTLHVGAAFVPNTGGVRLPITSTSAAQTGQPIGVDANGDIVRLAATSFDATVSFSTATPTAVGVVFTPNTPASTTVLYVSSVDGSQWTYNGTTYVTAPVSNDWKITGNAGTVQASNFVGTTDNVGLSIRTNNVIRQTISNSGNVGIGTTAPTLGSGGAGLNILNNSFTQLRLQSSSMSAGIEFKPSTGNEWELQASNSNQFFVYNRTKNQYRLLIDEIGNVGIGTVTPTAKLEVAGTVKIVDGTQGVGKVLTSDATGLATWQSKGFFQAQNVTGGWGASGKTVLTFTNKANTNYLVTVNASFYSTISSLQTLNLTNNGIQVLAINQFFNTTNNHTSVGGSFVLSTTAIVSNVLALKTTANSDFNDFCTITVVEL